MPFFAIVGSLLMLIFFVSGISVYKVGTSSMHEIYAGVLMMCAVISLLIITVATAADKILRAIQPRT